MTTESPVLFTLAEAAEYLRTTERHLQRLTETRAVGFNKVGMYVRFRQEDLDAYLASTHTPPTA